MLGILLGAAILGVIIAMMEDGEFPGWGTMVICVLATSVPSFAVSIMVGPSLWFLGPVVGSVAGGCAISATCGMSVKRASIAAAIYCVIQIGISYLLS